MYRLAHAKNSLEVRMRKVGEKGEGEGEGKEWEKVQVREYKQS